MKKRTRLLFSLILLAGCAGVRPASSDNVCTDCPAERIAYWNQWLDRCAPGNDASSTRSDWSNTTFRTEGVTYDNFRTDDPTDYQAMVKLYPADSIAQKYLPGVIQSGRDYPDRKVIKKGNYLSKLVKVGADISSPSPYYLTPKELKRLKRNPGQLEQRLGLPLTSNAGIYVEFRMYALADNTVFQSHIAPTVQYRSPDQGVYRTSGGAIQTLVINNRDAKRWSKESVPADTLWIDRLPEIDQRPDTRQ